MYDETARFELHDALRELLGEARGDTLMSLLPPVGWADVATTRDLDAMGERLDARIDALGERFDARIDALHLALEVLRTSTATQLELARLRLTVGPPRPHPLGGHRPHPRCVRCSGLQQRGRTDLGGGGGG